MVDVKNIVLLDFEDELRKLIELKNNGLLTDEKLDDSYNYMLDQLDIHYRQKDANDWTLDIIDIRNIVNELEYKDNDLIAKYGRVITYLL